MNERRDPHLSADISALLERSDMIFSKVKDHGTLAPDELAKLLGELTSLSRDAEEIVRLRLAASKQQHPPEVQ